MFDILNIKNSGENRHMKNKKKTTKLGTEKRSCKLVEKSNTKLEGEREPSIITQVV
jgi:hypothetical protein